MKFFGVADDRVECCAKGESGSDSDSSSGSKNDGSPRSVKDEEEDSD